MVSQDYLENVAIPYYAAVVAWLENVKICMSGSEMYDCTQAALLKEQFIIPSVKGYGEPARDQGLLWTS
ncbi:hypothetical protein [Paenibacillus antibioticophila]|uniref:hypothetical protein n=1 Tax=Paenibacillus antibioticophila TaxID=1274374 RepID=UPI0005C821C0|nr:hypothetical protein [Paenibacillus antibioticophila]